MIRAPYPAEEYEALAQEILNQPAYDGKTVVVCWVHTQLPELAKALGIKHKPNQWKDSVYDRIWLITYKGKKVSLSNLPQHLLPGDST